MDLPLGQNILDKFRSIITNFLLSSPITSINKFFLEVLFEVKSCSQNLHSECRINVCVNVKNSFSTTVLWRTIVQL